MGAMSGQWRGGGATTVGTVSVAVVQMSAAGAGIAPTVNQPTSQPRHVRLPERRLQERDRDSWLGEAGRVERGYFVQSKIGPARLPSDRYELAGGGATSSVRRSSKGSEHNTNEIRAQRHTLLATVSPLAFVTEVAGARGPRSGQRAGHHKRHSCRRHSCGAAFARAPQSHALAGWLAGALELKSIKCDQFFPLFLQFPASSHATALARSVGVEAGASLIN
jgi:hypothetical protein